jgi:hypothetical protein
MRLTGRISARCGPPQPASCYLGREAEGFRLVIDLDGRARRLQRYTALEPQDAVV